MADLEREDKKAIYTKMNDTHSNQRKQVGIDSLSGLNEDQLDRRTEGDYDKDLYKIIKQTD